jgi:CRP/FNR family nitrogen fixation transcriptional regulator
MLINVNQTAINVRKPSAIDALAGRRAFCGEFKYSRDTEIFGEVDSAEYVYQVGKGAVRSYKLLGDGRRQINAFHLPGDMFGVENGDLHRFTAEAVIETTVRIARRRSLFEGISDNLPAIGKVLALVTKSLQHAEDHMLLLGRKTALEKVAAFLTEMEGALQGIVTRTDLLEAVAGDLPKPARPRVTRRGDGRLHPRHVVPKPSYLIDAFVPFSEVVQLVGIDEVPSGDYVTLAGFVLTQLHELPKPGDHFVWDGWRNGGSAISSACTPAAGAVEVKVRCACDVPENMVLMPFCYAEAAANLLTSPALDPFGKIPEFKFCAVRAEKADCSRRRNSWSNSSPG